MQEDICPKCGLWNDTAYHCNTLHIQQSPDKGSYLVAGKSCREGELLFTEEPVALGPRAISTLICLGCHSPLADDQYTRCDACYWPLCAKDCPSIVNHAAECEVLSQDKKHCGSPTQSGETPRYDLILVLRALLLRSRPLQWQKIQRMRSHAEVWKERQDPYHTAAVRYLTEICSGDYSVDDVHQVRGAIVTNCYEIKGTGGSSLRGLYPLLGLLNHSCIPNVCIRADRNGKMFVQCATSVQKGEPLLVSYVDVLAPVWERLQDTKETYNFHCSCRRCLSEDELRTFFSCQKCFHCGDGFAVANPESGLWNCQSCKASVSEAEIETKVMCMLDRLDAKDFQNISPQDADIFLHGIENVFHSSHYVWVVAAQRVLNGISINTDLESLQLKRDLWKRLISLYEILEPGKTRRIGISLCQLVSVEVDLLQSGNGANEGSLLKLINRTEDILLLEPKDSNEAKWIGWLKALKNKSTIISTGN